MFCQYQEAHKTEDLAAAKVDLKGITKAPFVARRLSSRHDKRPANESGLRYHSSYACTHITSFNMLTSDPVIVFFSTATTSSCCTTSSTECGRLIDYNEGT